MANSDEPIRIDPDKLSLSDIDRVGVWDMSEVLGYGVNDRDPRVTIHTIRFRSGGRFVMTYAKDGTPVSYEASEVQFERLGDEFFVAPAQPLTEL